MSSDIMSSDIKLIPYLPLAGPFESARQLISKNLEGGRKKNVQDKITKTIFSHQRILYPSLG